MKQLILPPDVNEVTMQKQMLTPPQVQPATLDQASKWHRLNLCIKTKQNVHPQTIPLDHYTSQCAHPVKPKAKNAEWDDTAWQEEAE